MTFDNADSSTFFFELIDQLKDAILILDSTGSVRRANSAAESLFGMSQNELLGQNFGLPLTKGSVSEIEIISKNAPVRIAEIRSSELLNEGTKWILCSIRDIARTEGPEHQKTLIIERITSIQHRTLIDKMPIDMAYINRQGELLHSNPRFRRMLNFNGSDVSKPENVFLNSAFIQTGIDRLLRQSFEKATEVSSEVRLQQKDNKNLVLKCLIASVSDWTGDVLGSQLFLEDVTDHELTEKIRLENEKLKAVADLATGVAHNFNNILQVILGATSLALARIENGEVTDVKKQLHMIMENSELGAITVRRLQEFAGISVADDSAHESEFDLSQVVKNAVEMSRPWWKTNAELKGVLIDMKRELTPGLFLKGHEEDFFEVAMSLIKNAAEAMPQGGILSVSTGFKDSSIEFIVEDNGTGIPSEDQEKIFQPFWTTKGYHSSGLGLSSSLGIMNRYNGSISVDSQKGSGSRFTVTVPLENHRLPGPCGTNLPEDGKLRILCVDDDESILEILKEGLEMHGHSALVATNGQDAIEKFLEHGCDVVICDLGMPNMTGWDVAARMKEICIEKNIPKTPFFMLTGWGGQTSSKDRIEVCGIDAVFTKPVSFSHLMRQIESRLGTR